MNEGTISVIEAGRILERRKSTVFKVMKRLGIDALKRRDESSGNQLVSFLTQADFIRIRDELLTVRSEEAEQLNVETCDGFVSAEIGVFYLIQLEPDHDPLRYKVGFAANINDRLRALRCSAPFAKLLESWPCKRLWEKTAIDSVTSASDRLHTEVFRCSSIEAVIEKCGRFFEVMPQIQQ